MSPNSPDSTREKILQSLRINGQMTVSDLTSELDLTHIAIRHHLNALQADQLVEAREERHGVGRPRLLYRLTETALEQNPSKYLKLTNLLIDQLKEHLPQGMVDKLFMEVASSMSNEYKSQLADLPTDKRMEKLVQLLSEEGFVARLEPSGTGEYRMIELTCPYHKISLQHPEMCTLDASIISNALGLSVERKSCILQGSEACTFAVSDPEGESK